MTTPQTHPDYDALWHLVALGILTPDHAPNGWQVAPDAPRPTRVAVIDTSVAADHPNLRPAINRDLALDLFSTRLGAFPYRDGTAKIGALDLNAGTPVVDGLPHASELLAEMVDRLSHDGTAWLDGIQPMTGADFSSHGTAICGLVGARPAIARAADGYPSPVPGHDNVPLPYAGVDPHCEIVPISTNYNPDPEQLILALLYAELIDADVVLIPRTISDPSRTVPELNRMIGDHALRDLVAPTAITPAELEMWEELATLLVQVSHQRPIVCAAGNSNEEHGIYPANLASEHNGIISVGAVNAKGVGSSYSDTRHVTLCGPSDDGETYDRGEIRLDPHRADQTLPAHASAASNEKFSAFDIISTDVPGIYGYAGGPFLGDEPEIGLREFGSYFCRFGGTSAASAIVAGVLSLARSTGRLSPDADGIEAKSFLLTLGVKVSRAGQEITVPAWNGELSFPDSPAPAETPKANAPA